MAQCVARLKRENQIQRDRIKQQTAQILRLAKKIVEYEQQRV